MNNKAHKPTKAELLRELESIHASLTENADPTKVREKPTELSDTSDDNDYLLHIPETSSKDALKSEETMNVADTSNSETQACDQHPMQNQQSLFIEPTNTATTGTPPEPQKPLDHKEVDTDGDENPFLPQRVKDRLEKERALYQKEIDEATKAYATKPAKVKKDDSHSLVDQLVAEYLPKIEQELRKRLKQRLETPASEN